MTGPPRILVSACLLGGKVRYDGGDKRDPWLAGSVGPFVEWVPVCPEVECGLPVPRPPMRLEGDPDRPRLVEARSGADHTGRMAAFAARKLDALEGAGVCGYVCKEGSPSCGLARLKVFGGAGGPVPRGAGLFTRAFGERFPLVPVEEAARLADPGVREAFLERVFTLKRFRELAAGGRTRGRLVAFHADHKYLILSHGRKLYEELGRVAAGAEPLRGGALYDRYGALLMRALGTAATPGRCADALTHMAGHFREHLDSGDRAELQELIERFRRGLEPRSVPAALLRHYARKYRVDYIARQRFLDPHPAVPAFPGSA